MASEGHGKFKEKKSRLNRSSKPYDRPKGIIRRVTDSVTGLFSSSWLSGWMAGEEEEEASDPQQPGSSQGSSQSRVSPQVKTMAPPGESFIFAQPVTARRPFRPIYPEEGEIEGNSQQAAHGVNVGASTSSGVRMNLATATSVANPSAASATPSTENPSPVLVGRRHPIISSTPTQQMFTARTKSQLEPRPLPLLTSSTPTGGSVKGDDGSEFSESSVDTGVDASVIPRPDERDYQREILQLDEESLLTLRESLAKSAPAPPTTNQPASALPSLEETRKRPRDVEPDQGSLRAEGSLSISNRSLFSESGDVSLSQPQPSALASKRPRFNVSAYGSPIMFDNRSVLSDSSFRMSPFYPGKTMFGGASAYRRGRQQARAQTTRVQVKPKPSQSSDDGGLSRSARRILECLEQMSTPISDAKRIPTPIPGQRGSFLDAATGYTAAYHRHRPSPRQPGPPAYRPSTPSSKAAAPEKIAANVISTISSAVSGSRDPGTSAPTTTASSETSKPEVGTPAVGEEAAPSKEDDEESTAAPKEDFSASFSKAVAEATAKFKPTMPVMPTVTSSPSPFEFISSSKSSASLPFVYAPKPAEATAALSSGFNKTFSGKERSKVVPSSRTCSKRIENEETVEEPNLPAVSLNISSLPKIDFTTTTISSTPLSKVASSPEGFKFASPEVVHGDKILSKVAMSLPVFTFSSPAAVGCGNVNDLDSAATAAVPLLFNSCSSSSAPKLKEVVKKDKTAGVGELKEGSILDILKPKRASPEKIPKENSSPVAPVFNNIGGKSATIDTSFGKTPENVSGVVSEQSSSSSTVDSVPKKTESSSQGFQGFSSFMKSSDEWECSVCMIRNKNTAEKCIACETSKPGLNSKSSDSSSLISNAVEDPPPPALNSIVGGWGNAFKKSDNEWECEICMIRNKDSSDKCVACETPKPGSKSEPLSQDSKVLESKEEKTNIGFGSMFAKAKGEWECDTCLVRNKSDASRCVSCETPKPGAVAVSQAITGNFRFGVNTNDSSTSSTFKFGVSDSLSEVKSSSGFKFGVSAKTNEESNSRGSGGFKFGVSEGVKPSALTEGSKDVASDKSKENSECVGSSSSSSFKFGLNFDKAKKTDGICSNITFANKLTESKTETAVKKTDGIFSNTTFANKLTESKTETANAVTPKTGFNFKAGSQDAAPFTFGATLKRKPEKDKNGSTTEIKPASELKSGSVADALKEKNTTVGAFSFGSKAEKSSSEEGSAVKPPSIFNNALSTTLHNDGESKSITPTFGSAKPKDAISTGQSLIFGSKTGENTATSHSFTFGKDTPKAPQSFSFTSPVSKEESVSVPSFSFGSKRELSDSEEPSKRITFGSTSTPLTNSVNSKPLFTFGSKENTLSTGTGFGPPPTSTPAFGAPAPTCSAAPSFQFGHNNNPVPAATAPTATAPAPTFGSAAPAPTFGSATTAFGSNNSTASFAFGQGAKKNISAGFDFGQAASSASNQGFNFGGAGATAPVFQFGQKQSDPAAGGLFQFGTVEASAPSFGENSFNAPAPPSGRVVKKARRRKQ